MSTDLRASGTTAARELIDQFSVEEEDYAPVSRDVASPDNAPCKVFSRGDCSGLELEISGNGQNNRLFLGDGVTGQLSLGFEGDDSVIFIGRDVHLSKLHIGSRQNNDFVAIGNDVATTGPGRWISGLRAGPVTPSIVIGDACVLARDVTLRNTDGHPIFSADLVSQRNSPSQNLIVEPHCWIGERAAILKNVTVGAFSIVGFSAVVTESVPRHHTAKGNPAVARANTGGVWSWDDSTEGLSRAQKYLDRYPIP